MKTFLIFASFGLLWASPLLDITNFASVEEQSNNVDKSPALTLIDRNITACYHESNNPVSLEDVSKTLVSSSIRFGLKMFQTLTQFEDKNASNGIIFSPVSIWSTLLVAYLGSRGQAETEIRKRLKLEDYNKASLSVAFHGISMLRKLKALSSSTNQSTISNEINKIFISDRLEVNQCFSNIFPDMVQTMNFAGAPANALQEINDLVRNSTYGNFV